MTMAGSKINEKGEVFTKTLFLNGTLKERLVPAYFALQERLDLPDLPTIDSMLLNHSKCPYWTLLHQICPCGLDLRGQMKKKRRKSIATEVDDAVSVKCVFLFIRRVFLKIVPVDALGSIKNRNHFLNQVQELLSVPVHGKMSISFLTANIKTKCIMWLNPFDQKEKRLKLQSLIKFLIVSFLGPLIQSFFYVSPCGESNELKFFRKKVWQRLTQIAFKKFITECKLKPVSGDWVQNERKNGKCLGVSVARFLPKRGSLRPVVNCSKRHNGRVSVNDHLKTLYLVLSHERQAQTERFGASILGVDEFHLRWKTYLKNMKNKCVRRYYFVRADLLKCYDNIDPTLVYKTVRGLLGDKDSYTVYRYKKLTFYKGKSKTKYFESLNSPIAVYDQNQTNLIGSYEVKTNVLLEKLHALLFCNIVKLGRQHFVQTLGISQGACLSSLLCALYFGYMDSTSFSHLLGHHNFLVRMTDDMLYVTPHKDKAKSFIQMILDGVPDMNCRGNFEKCFINFAYCHPAFGNVQSQPNSISYCGICLNPITLETSLDHSNYKDKSASETVSWELTQNAGAVLKNKILKSFRPKCFSVLFDADINSKECIEDSLLCIFAVCAMKFHHLVMKLPVKQRAVSNPSFFTGIILRLPNELTTHVSRKLKRMSEKNKTKLVFPVPEATVHSLCNLSFLYKLQRHHGMYAHVIDNLHALEKKKRWNAAFFKKVPEIFNKINIKH